MDLCPFFGTLLKDLHQLQSNREVWLQKYNGEKKNMWVPLSGPLYDKNGYYSMTFVSKHSVINIDILMTAFVGHICPAEAVDWLSCNTYLFKQWWSTILHQTSQENDIEKIIQIAAEKSGITLIGQSALMNTSDIRADFIKYLETNRKHSSEHIFKINDGIFVSLFLLEDFLSENRFTATSTFFETLDKANCLILNNGNYHHQLYPKEYEDKRVLHGIILNFNAISEALKNLPINN